MASITMRNPYVVKRNGKEEIFCSHKIASRIQKMCYNLNQEYVNLEKTTNYIINGLFSGMTTAEIDDVIAHTLATMAYQHPHYNLLAARIAISKLHKETKESFSDVINDLYNAMNVHIKKKFPLISEYHYKIINGNADRINTAIVHSRDFDFTYFNLKILEKSYLLKINGNVVERPQYMLMRVAIGIHGEDIDAAIETYEALSRMYFSHSPATCLNAATSHAQLSSDFLVEMKEDSIEGIFKTLETCAVISKCGGTVGLHVHCIRATNSYIAGTNGSSNGLVPMLRVYDTTTKYVERGNSKRPGAFAIYLEPWHADIFEILELRKRAGKEEKSARALFYALWVPDEFMRRVENNQHWSLMCPNSCPGLFDCYGEQFDDLYKKYESEKHYVKQIEARKLWFAILSSQVETGMPYVMYKDACNKKSNQQNVGTIKGSNLCAEIIEYSAPEEVAVCNLASIAVNKFIKSDGVYDFQRLKKITKITTRNLNKIIDVTHYPVAEAKKSNLRHRPIGIGVQGLADLFLLMRLPFGSEESQLLNTQVFETIYYSALEASCELAEKLGPYDTYKGSPISKGFDMWNVKPTCLWNWSELRKKIKVHGVRNSLLVACTPTESILGNSDSIEPYSSNVYVLNMLSDQVPVVNSYLQQDLLRIDQWDDDMRRELLKNCGSVQNISRVPKELKELYKTVWEIKQKMILKMAADRAPFIDQSQSLNVYIAEPSVAKLSSMHFYGWKVGLKTGVHYLRTQR